MRMPLLSVGTAIAVLTAALIGVPAHAANESISFDCGSAVSQSRNLTIAQGESVVISTTGCGFFGAGGTGGTWSYGPTGTETSGGTATSASLANGDKIIFTGTTVNNGFNAGVTIYIGPGFSGSKGQILIRVTSGTPAFTASTPPTSGTVGTAYVGYTFAASGTAPITFARASGSLPPGLTLASNGSLSGTPSAAGSYTFTVSATNTVGTVTTSSVTISVSEGPAFTASTPPTSGTVGTAYVGYTFAASGTAPITFARASGSLPPGLTLASNGSLSGTPSAAGSYTFTVSATNTVGTVTTSSITIVFSDSTNQGGGEVPPGPAPWFQSYGRASDATCRPGWHASWAEWAVPSTGGWVCNRTVYWDGSAWMQNPDWAWGAIDPALTSAWDGA